jgi:vitamin B12 transporter
MKTSFFSARLAVLPLALSAVFPAFAQTQATPQLQETVVTATRSAQPIGDVVADVTIIDRETIERAGAVGLADVLARVPGVEMVRNGGTGNATSVALRGGEGRHTALLINGVRADSQTTSGGASWNAIPLSQIERIEVVRGPSSAVYGSDAVAGVVQVFTKKGEGPFAPSVGVTYGSYNTHRVDMSASGSAGAFDYSFGLSEGSSDGFNIRPAPAATVLNLDNDGYKAKSANARLGFQINRDQRVEATVLHSTIDTQYDGGLSTGATAAIRAANLRAARSTDYRRTSTLTTAGAQWLSQWTGQYSTKLGVSTSTDRGEENVGGAVDQTRITSVLFQNEYRTGAHLFSAMLEKRNDQFALTSVPSVDRSKSQSGVGLGYAWSQSAHTVQLNIRNDNDSEFGGKTTGSAAYAFAITPQWKVSASAGTSYRTPTLYQRFSQYGVPNLQPESGRNTEVGLKYAEGSTEYGATVYRNRMTNLLTFLSGAPAAGCPVPASGCYSNTARAQYEGVTLSASQRLGGYRVYGSLDLQDPKDKVQDKVLARRARTHAVIGVDTHAGIWDLGADVLLSSKRYDSVANTVTLQGYGLLNLSASTAISRDWKITAKLDNATDKVYQTAGGYAMAGRAVYVGLTWTPL